MSEETILSSIFAYDYFISDRLNQFKLVSLFIDNLSFFSVNLIKNLAVACERAMHKRSKLVRLEQEANMKIFKEQANDLNYIRILKSKAYNEQLKILNLYLPLFESARNNIELKQEYLNLIAYLLENDDNLNMMDCYETAVLLCMHSAFSDQEKTYAKKWKINFEQTQINRLRFDLDEYSFNLKRKESTNAASSMRKMSKSLTNLKFNLDSFDGYFDLTNIVEKKETKQGHINSRMRQNYSADHRLKVTNSLPIHNNAIFLNEQSASFSSNANQSITDSSESNDAKNDNEIPNFKYWLKHIRLHKYTPGVSNLTYDELVSLKSDDELKQKFQMTSGASKKFLNYIGKIRNRNETLRLLTEQIDRINEEINLESILEELLEVSLLPMKRLQTIIIENDSNANEETNKLFLALLDKTYACLEFNFNRLSTKTSQSEAELENHNKQMALFSTIVDNLILSKGFDQGRLVHLCLLKDSSNRLKSTNENTNLNNNRTINYLNARQRIINKNVILRTFSSPLNK